MIGGTTGFVALGIVGLLGLVAVGAVIVAAWYSRRGLKSQVDDYENEADIRRRADAADERVRKYDDAGWRD